VSHRGALLVAVAIAACGGGGKTAAPDAPDAPDTAPSVVFTMPAQGASEVAGDTAITVNFSKPIDPASVSATSFTVADDAGTAVAGTIVAWPDGAALTPAMPLDDDRTYTATLAGVTDLDGTPLAAPVSWSFSTHRRAWGMPVAIDTAGLGTADSPRIAMNDAGTAFAVWRQNTGSQYETWANVYAADTGWGTAKLVSFINGNAAPNARIAVDPVGDAVAA